MKKIILSLFVLFSFAFSSVKINDLTKSQIDLLKIASKYGKIVGYPETIMAILLAESEAGKAAVIGDIFLPPFERSYGVMQVRLPTAKLVIKNNYFNFDKEDEYLMIKMITDQEFNIAIATSYYKYLLDFFKGEENQWSKSVIGYNSGPGNSRKFLEIGRTTYLKKIKNYIKLIRSLKEQEIITY